jgi:hypothetical protein
MNQYGIVIVIVAAVLAVGMWWMWGKGKGAPAASGVKAYYVDEDTGEESVRPETDIPPLKGKNGKDSVVWEMKYSCDGGKTSKVGYYMKYTPEGKQALEDAHAAGKDESSININMMEQLLVRLPESGSPWVPKHTALGMRITENGQCGPGERKMGMVPK